MCLFCDLEDKTKEIGEYFGYPPCCIQWQIDTLNSKDELKDPLNLMQKQINERFGFMPCPSCAEKVYKKEITISGLIQNRICKTPYPKEGDINELIKYLKNDSK
jgi:hypothetical protein